jgi:metal-sulfur cluster biosynthetic enzyme
MEACVDSDQQPDLPDVPVADIWNALHTVCDPCHRLSGHALSILDLGLVNRVTPMGEEVEIGLTLTEVSCTFGHRIIQDIEAVAADFPEFSRFRVVIEPFPLWTPARLSERAREYYRRTRALYGPRTAGTRSPAIPNGTRP